MVLKICVIIVIGREVIWNLSPFYETIILLLVSFNGIGLLLTMICAAFVSVQNKAGASMEQNCHGCVLFTECRVRQRLFDTASSFVPFFHRKFCHGSSVKQWALFLKLPQHWYQVWNSFQEYSFLTAVVNNFLKISQSHFYWSLFFSTLSICVWSLLCHYF